METLEKKLDERRQRLENMEGEPTQSDSGEKEVVSKLRAPEKEKDSEAEDRLIVSLFAEIDERMAEHVSFVSDDHFIKSKECKSFLYHFKGKKLREAVPNVTPDNEVEMMMRLKKDIDIEVETMTSQRGRQLLVEAGIIVFPGWDLSASFIFDSLLHSANKDMKLNIQGVQDIFIGSRYDPKEEEMLLWALYPPNKRPKIIDVDKTFGHMMTLKVGEVDPIVIADMGINISKFNKAQMKHEIVKKNKYKALYEEALKRSGHPVPQITDSGGKWKKKIEKLSYEHNKLKKQMKSIRADTACVLLSRRYDNMEKALNELWGEYQRNMDNMISHTRIRDRLDMMLQDAMTKEKEKKKVEGLLVTHDGVTEALKFEFDECQHIVEHGVPSLVDDAGVIKDKTVWISE